MKTLIRLGILILFIFALTHACAPSDNELTIAPKAEVVGVGTAENVHQEIHIPEKRDFGTLIERALAIGPQQKTARHEINARATVEAERAKIEAERDIKIAEIQAEKEVRIAAGDNFFNLTNICIILGTILIALILWPRD